jgi:molecular chaperone HscB
MSRTPAAAANPSPSDFFAVLGLLRQFDLAAEAIEREYLARAAAVHPDRFVGGGSAQQRQAMERSSAVNEAYRTLRDPVARAEYLVKLGGIDLDSSDPQTGAPAMDQLFLVDMIERREAVAEAREGGDAALDDLRARVEDERDAVFDRAVAQLSAGDVGPAARSLVARRYFQRLIDEIDGAT